MAERKIWTMREVNPWEYETTGDKRLKDWAQGELEARLAKGCVEDEEAELKTIALRKQLNSTERNRRLSPEQIQALSEMYQEARVRHNAEKAGLILPT